MLATAALRSPDRIALKMENDARTFGVWHDRSTRLANALLGQGLKPGDRLGAWLHDCIEYIELYAAVAKAGIVLVPVNERLTAREAQFQLEQSGAAGLVFSPDVDDKVSELDAAGELRCLIAVGHSDLEASSFEKLIAAGSTVLPPEPHEDSAFMICYTSGTTGFPKGAVISHRAAKNGARTQMVAMRVPTYGTSIHTGSLSFPATVTSHIITHLYAGGCSFIFGKFDVERMLRVVEAERATFSYVPSPAIDEFTELASRNPPRWQTLRALLHAGSRVEPGLLHALADVIGERYLEAWGMTEISGVLAAATTVVDYRERGHDPNFYSVVGRPLPDVVVRVVDDERNEIPHDGEAVGELVVRSSSMMDGYWDNREATDRVLVDGWYHTGDLGTMHPDGMISIVDRRTDMIVSGGMNVYPAEVELALAKLDGVADCAVVAGEHPRWGQTVVAVVVPQPDAQLTEDRVIEFSRESLASYKKPTRVVFVETLPRTSSGKVQRGVLRDQIAGNKSASNGES
jgi:acyl-CoA synthetase (AMP-forming)/AMP-acid ligase II